MVDLSEFVGQEDVEFTLSNGKVIVGKVIPNTDIKKLEKQIEEYQNKLQELQSQVEEMKAKEEANKLPEIFNRDHAINFLDGFHCDDLFRAFAWGGTPQGYNYWFDLFIDLQSGEIQKAPDEAIMIIQNWIIQSYRE